MRILTKQLIATLIAIALCSTLGFAYGETNDETFVYQSSNIKNENLSITVENNCLRFLEIPDRKEFNYLWLFIKEMKDGQVITKIDKTYSRQQLLNGNQTISLSSLSDGQYYVEIFGASEEYSTYKSYLHGKGLQIEKLNQTAILVTPIVYAHNQSVHQLNRTDEHALRYYRSPSDDIQSNDLEITKLSKEITLGLDSDYDKTKAIHDWVCNHIWYDWDALTGKTDYGDTSAVGTLKSKKSVCQGYASLTAALLRASGIPAKLVTGYALGVGEDTNWKPDVIAKNESNHAWNEVYVDGRWIIIDTTWDSDNKYENGTFSNGTGLKSYKYFDSNLSGFSSDHMLCKSNEEIPNWWNDEQNHKYYMNEKGIPLTGLQKLDDEKYYFDSTGIMKTGWQTINGKKYYFNKDGTMAQNVTMTIDSKKYTFDANGQFKLKRK